MRRASYDAVVMIRLASNGPQTLHADTIGAAWLAVAGQNLAEGVASRYDDRPVREISLVTLVVDQPGPDDGNLVELAALQQQVAGQLWRPAGRLLMVVKSAHVYETERGYLLGVLGGARVS